MQNTKLQTLWTLCQELKEKRQALIEQWRNSQSEIGETHHQLAAELSSLRKQNALLAQDLQQLSGSLAALKAHWPTSAPAADLPDQSQLLAQISELNQEIHSLTAELNEKNQALSALGESTPQAQAELAELQSGSSSLEQEVQVLFQAVQALREQFAIYSRETEQHQVALGELDTLKAELAEAQAATEAAQSQAQADREQVQAELEQLKAQFEAVQADAEVPDDESEALRQEVERIQREAEQLQSELDEARNQMVAAQARAEEGASVDQQLQALQADLDAARKEAEQAKALAESVQESARQDLEELEKELERYKQAAEGAGGDSEEQSQLQAQLEAARTEAERATALAEEIQQGAKEELESLMAEIAALKAGGGASSEDDEVASLREQLDEALAEAERIKDELKGAASDSDDKEGSKDAVLENSRKKMTLVLKKRFNKVPRRVHNRLKKVTTSKDLDSLFEKALDCESMDDFSNALEEVAGE